MTKTLIIDFDGTITENVPYAPYSYGKIREGIKAALDRYFVESWYIIVYTCRSWAEKEKIRRHLVLNYVFFDEIICCKPIGQLYVDTNAMSAKEFIEGKNP